MRAAVSTGTATVDEVLDAVRAAPEMAGQALAAGVSLPGARDASRRRGPSGRTSSLLDYGVKGSIVRLLLRGRRAGHRHALGLVGAADVLAASPDGILLANGPGDPAALPACVDEVRAMLEARPVFGICLGHQLLGRALGLETFKLRFGHRGANHPVLELDTGRVLVTAQNHGFAVRGPDDGPRVRRPSSDRALVTHTSLYDGTVEGLALRDRDVSSLQFHPEASPGPHDAREALSAFVDRVATPIGPPLPRRADIRSVAVIGSGPIVIGQACEFDYSGSQALRVLRAEGIRTVLINSNPATIMTDSGWADRTYLEPLDVAGVEAVLRRERPDALLPTLGGQTALNLSSQLHEAGILDELGIELIGASYDAIRRAEDRELFAATMASIGLRVPTSVIATSMQDARAALATGALHLPVVVRPGVHARRPRRRLRRRRPRSSSGGRARPAREPDLADPARGVGRRAGASSSSR